MLHVKDNVGLQNIVGIEGGGGLVGHLHVCMCVCVCVCVCNLRRSCMTDGKTVLDVHDMVAVQDMVDVQDSIGCA